MAKSKSVLPSPLGPVWTAVVWPWLRVFAWRVAGWPMLVSVVWLKTVQKSLVSAAEIGVGVEGLDPGRTVVAWPTGIKAVCPFALTAIVPCQSS